MSRTGMVKITFEIWDHVQCLLNMLLRTPDISIYLPVTIGFDNIIPIPVGNFDVVL